MLLLPSNEYEYAGHSMQADETLAARTVEYLPALQEVQDDAAFMVE